MGFQSAAPCSRSAALGFCFAAFCRDAWFRVSLRDGGVYPGRAGWLLLSAFCRGTRFRVSSFDRAIYPPRREVPRHPLSRLRFMGVFTPVAAPHPRFAWARTVYPRCKRNAKSPQPPVLPRSLGLSIKILRVLIRRAATTDRAARAIHARQLVTSNPRFLRARERFSRPARSVPAASLQRPFGEGIGEASARRDLRRTRGWSCAVLSQPHRNDHHLRGACAPPRTATRGKPMDRGRRPPQGGKPSAAVFRQACLVEKCRARFWAASPPASPPSFAENPLEVRSTHLRQDEHTLKSDPRPMAHARATLGTNGARTNRARGWEAQGNSLGKREAQRQRRRAEGQRTIQPPSWDFSRTCPSARESGIGEAFGKAITQPQTPPRRARWGNDQVGTNTGMLLARSPIGRGAAGAEFLALSLERAKRSPTKRIGRTARIFLAPPRLAYALRNRFFNRNPMERARSAGVGVERGLSTRFSNRHQVFVRRQPRGSFGSYAPRCKQSYQHRAVSGPLWVGPPTARR